MKDLTPEGFVENRRDRRLRKRVQGKIRQKPPPWVETETKGVNQFPIGPPGNWR